MDETSTEHKNTSKPSNRIGKLRGYNQAPYDTPIETCHEQSIDLLLYNFKSMSLDLETNLDNKQQPKTPPPAASPKFPGHLSNPRPLRVSSGSTFQPEPADSNPQCKEKQPIDHQPAMQKPSSPPLEPQQRNDLRHDRSQTEMRPPSSSPLQPQQHEEQEHDHRQPEMRPPSSRPLQSQQCAEEGNFHSQPEMQTSHRDEPEMQPPSSRPLPPQQREEQGPYQSQPEMHSPPSCPQLPEQDSERHNPYPPQMQQASSTSKSQRAPSLPPPHPKHNQPRMQPPPPLHPLQSEWHHQDSERRGFPQVQMEQAPSLPELQAQQYEHGYRPAPYLPPVQPQGRPKQGHEYYQVNQPMQSPPLQPHQREEHRHASPYNIGGQNPGSFVDVLGQHLPKAVMDDLLTRSLMTNLQHSTSTPPMTPSAYPGSISSPRGHRESPNSSPAVMRKNFRTSSEVALQQPVLNSSHAVDSEVSSTLQAVSARQDHDQEASPQLINAEKRSRVIIGKLPEGVPNQIVWYQSRSDKQIARPPLLNQFHGPNIGEVYVHSYISEGQDAAQIWLFQGPRLGWSDVSAAFLSDSVQIPHPLTDTRILVRYLGRGFEPSYVLRKSRRPVT
ncbi:hypothetical protein K443DRAFT_5666 [Laccaria amethystina LaAM-08-1]|uniref:Uncharacterized protein n=1 Tax=Laccaria amethystina LaAM-08-1 TaxID=1095629 RepID=A0A0C9Y4S5_9AGAR|nr:hypothetical protein K443DRAFT_5666 [Laccaria amethystina LaAM-08-1]